MEEIKKIYLKEGKYKSMFLPIFLKEALKIITDLLQVVFDHVCAVQQV
jgi:hypothetical protein